VSIDELDEFVPGSVFRIHYAQTLKS
jgi:hypothetical protein